MVNLDFTKNCCEEVKDILEIIAEQYSSNFKNLLCFSRPENEEFNKDYINNGATLIYKNKEYVNKTYSVSCKSMSEIIPCLDIFINQFYIKNKNNLVSFRKQLQISRQENNSFLISFRAAIINSEEV